MSWANELYQIFENFHDRTDFSKRMLPISHSTAKAQIEITIREDGTFSSAKLVEKEDSETVIPVTEDSCTRTSGVVPMPYAEKLPYIAGDYGAYTGKSNQDKYKAYVKQLASWDASEYTHPSVHALLLYVQKGCIIHDLVNSGLLKQNEDRTKLSDEKINGIAPEDVFLRFRVDYKNLECENCTWRDETLQKCFIAYQRSLLHNRQMCYATGEECLVTYKHPAKIRNAGDKAKLISANDERGFSYLGRFSTKNEAFSIGYEYSQKIHNALKWPLGETVKDTADILQVGKEEVYTLIEKMLCSVKESFSTNRIHLGMDEAAQLGLGKYLRENGYTKSSVLIREHSARVFEICKKLEQDKILFIPDPNLGRYVAEQLPEKTFAFYKGGCPRHIVVSAKDVEKASATHPDALFLVHPECRQEVVEQADYVGSTTGIMEFAKKSEHKEFIIGTENSIVEHLQFECPDKKFYPVAVQLTCMNMKVTTLMDIYNCLKGQGGEEILLPENIMEGAGRCIHRMVELGG